MLPCAAATVALPTERSEQRTTHNTHIFHTATESGCLTAFWHVCQSVTFVSVASHPALTAPPPPPLLPLTRIGLRRSSLAIQSEPAPPWRYASEPIVVRTPMDPHRAGSSLCYSQILQFRPHHRQVHLYVKLLQIAKIM
ncbi:hypothetical protein AOLI_G00160230 [Acnodon oligacanthus]